MFNEKRFRNGLVGFDFNQKRISFWCKVEEYAKKRAEKITDKQKDKLMKAMYKSGMNEAERLMLLTLIYG